jgi:hypothetical protein
MRSSDSSTCFASYYDMIFVVLPRTAHCRRSLVEARPSPRVVARTKQANELGEQLLGE